MRKFEIFANYKGLELNLGTVLTNFYNAEDLKALEGKIKNKHNVSEVVLKEIKIKRNEILEEVLPF